MGIFKQCEAYTIIFLNKIYLVISTINVFDKTKYKRNKSYFMIPVLSLF